MAEMGGLPLSKRLLAEVRRQKQRESAGEALG